MNSTRGSKKAKLRGRVSEGSLGRAGASDFRHPSTEERRSLRGVECRFEDAGFALRLALFTSWGWLGTTARARPPVGGRTPALPWADVTQKSCGGFTHPADLSERSFVAPPRCTVTGVASSPWEPCSLPKFPRGGDQRSQERIDNEGKPSLPHRAVFRV